MTRETSFLQMQARTQRFTLGIPKEIKVAPDGTRVLFLRSPSGEERRHSLWQLDLATGKESVLADPAVLLADGDEELTAEERARRERTRSQASGIVGNATDSEARIVAFALSGRLYVTDALTGETKLLETATPVYDPRPNPTGTHIAYVCENALRVVNVDGTGDRALAEPEGENRAYGLAEFIAAEEMNRSRGYWWSPDGQRLCVTHTDRSPVHLWHISDPANPAAEPHIVHYPAAGTPNVKVQLLVLGLDGSRVPVDWTGTEYLANVHWSAGGPPLISVFTRDQRTMQIRTVDPDTGETELLHEQTDPHWVDIVTGVPAWTSDGRLVRVVAGEHAYRLVVDGKQVTDLPLQVRSVLDTGDDVLFTASAEDPTRVHVYRAGADGVTQLSSVDGVSSAARAGDITVLTSWRMDVAGPDVAVLRKDEPIGKVDSLALAPTLEPTVIELTLGERKLRGALMFPAGHEPGSGKLPVLLDPYGGPHAQRVLASRNAYLTSQWLADQGFAVLVVDGRGTPGRGPAWEREIAFDLADVTLIDQIDGLHAAAALYPDLDLSRVGIRGWSYGGYLAALAVLRRPDVFHAAIAGAPVTDWTLYDTFYTERYLGHPETHPEVYERNALPPDAPNLERPLMLIHGMADDNVVLAHSLRLSSALVAAGRPHTLLPLPNVSHMTPQDESTAENFLLLQTTWLHDALGKVR
ncbi:prolyl oligopeptidase family serine peptidase [Kibdelosporangium philippinense]|uniref:Prolyl oligopeptidase family serine peptidase n=1 Tax=Kibdelosporangium philippinense TaxID=211113 RepID=A0ABS8ZPV2_9PSEU|nr:prolyl oligopeptidase family serine peptidase [Kibdelosporangium philippinense]MCE7009771.1 prolyl oligopeptidase family serine peptidase [Kibdelosporangium philippinense]